MTVSMGKRQMALMLVVKQCAKLSFYRQSSKKAEDTSIKMMKF